MDESSVWVHNFPFEQASRALWMSMYADQPGGQAGELVEPQWPGYSCRAGLTAGTVINIATISHRAVVFSNVTTLPPQSPAR